jgi:Protein of unknown function (DUF3160)
MHVKMLTIISCCLFIPFLTAGVTGAEGIEKMKADPQQTFSAFYTEDPLTINPAIPAYSLPLDPSVVSNWDFVFKTRASELASAADLVRQQGFGAVVTNRYDEFSKAYSDLKDRDIPIFVSADTFLHLYHIQFDETLKHIEETYFYEDLLYMLAAMERDLSKRNVEPALHSGKKLALDLLRLMLSCLDPEQAAEASPAVLSELQLIDQHGGFADSPLLTYKEDYSQYVPRGHYTRSEVLKRYFKAMMAAGRMTLLIKGGKPFGQFSPYLVSEDTARQHTIAALLLAESLTSAAVPDGRSCQSIWERIYTMTSFYAGLADDLTPTDYLNALKASDAATIEDLASNQDRYISFKTEIARLSPPAIYSGTGNIGTIDMKTVSGIPAPEILDKALAKTTGFRFMGQRFIPDSYFMGRLVFPTVGGKPLSGKPFTTEMTGQGLRKVWPRGLDIMSLLGSNRAIYWLTKLKDDQYNGYEKERIRLADELNSLDAGDWHRNAYWSWLDVLKTHLKPLAQGYQTFQLQPAWQDKSLNACLGSWSQLRHDTILYAKQSYTMLAKSAMMPPKKKAPGYVEPSPQTYRSLRSLTRMTRLALEEFELLSPSYRTWFSDMEHLLEQVQSISELELQNKPLSEKDSDFIRTIGSRISGILERQRTLDVPAGKSRAGKSELDKKTTIIADVHTDSNTEQVLEEGTGWLDMAVVCVRFPDGSLQLAVGPIFSHFEFKHPLGNRLTDEAWRNMLATGKVPDRGEWTSTYITR